MADQLALPLRIEEAHAPRLSLPRSERIFVNRDLDLSSIQWVGFDLDSTLVTYKEENLSRLIIEHLLEQLSREYPAAVSKLKVDPGFIVRGLVIDTNLGHVLKLDQYHQVRRATHGTYRLDLRTIQAKYRARRVSMSKPRFRTIDGLHDRVLGSVYVALIHALEARRTDIDYARLFEDVKRCSREVYERGGWISEVVDHFDRYVERDDGVLSALSRFRSSGKRLFLLTNSPMSYVSKVLSYVLDAPGRVDTSWRQLFSVVVTSADKPAFFRSKRQTDRPAPRSNRAESKLRLVEGGSLGDLEQWLGVSPNRILYVGDHVYGDILKSRKNGSWQTALIINELDGELSVQETSSHLIRRIYHLQAQRLEMDEQLRQNQRFLKELDAQLERTGAVDAIESKRVKVKKAIEGIRGKLRALSRDEAQVSEQLDACYHPRWGPLLREGNDLSSFGAQVQEYASIYTSHVSNFQRYSATQAFRSHRKQMAHER